MGNTILRGEKVFEEGKTREELEEELIEDDDREKMRWENEEKERGAMERRRMGEPGSEANWRKERIESYGR